MPRFKSKSEYTAYAKARRKATKIKRPSFPVYKCDKCGQILKVKFSHYNRCN